MRRKEILLHYLADGKFYSGQFLADALGISRTAIWKHVHTLKNYGLDICSVRGKGYRLSKPIELLDRSSIESACSSEALGLIKNIEIMFETESTNQQLLDKLSTDGIHARLVLAEFQTAGRGRRGSSWISPAGAGICLSIGWCFDSVSDSLTALSLAVGVAVVRALKKTGVEGVFLKWPNDIICQDRKLGGILVESRGEMAGPSTVVIGIGLNVDLSEEVMDCIGQPVTDLARLMKNPPLRNDVAGAIISETIDMLNVFATHGFAAFLQQWRDLDYARDKQATLMLPNKMIQGRVQGVDDNGMLVMLIEGQLKKFSSGELSLRIASSINTTLAED